jgi:hypothetical protein
MKDESVIPEGLYCYTRVDGKYVNCPYWGRDDSKPEQESGFCTFLDIRDWDEGTGVPLLWDQVKTCGINNPHENWEKDAF